MRPLSHLVRSHPWFTAFSAAYTIALTAFGFGPFPVRALTYLGIVLLDFTVVAVLNRKTRLAAVEPLGVGPDAHGSP